MRDRRRRVNADLSFEKELRHQDEQPIDSGNQKDQSRKFHQLVFRQDYRIEMIYKINPVILKSCPTFL
jgi:hypothetical protein